MNYVYDVMLNFQKDFFDFYEWNIEDKLINIHKIPILKVSNQDFKNIKNSQVKFDKSFIPKNKNQKHNHVFLISNGKNVIGIKLNKNGTNYYKSSLLLNDEEEIVNNIKKKENNKIKYKIIKNNNKNYYLTRNERKRKKEVYQKLHKLFQNKEEEKIKYIYLECFNKTENNVIKAYNIIKKEILTNNITCDKIYNFFNINK